MLKQIVVAAAFGVAMLSVGLVAKADDKGGDKLDLKGLQCMFCKMQVKEDVAVDYKGAKVFLGCEGCVSAFQSDPQKVAAKANHQLVATKQAIQKGCPVSGQPIKKEHMLTVAKAEVGFCCPNCKAAAEGLKGDAQLEKIFGEAAFAKGFEVVTK